jgi:hypothetical protein
MKHKQYIQPIGTLPAECCEPCFVDTFAQLSIKIEESELEQLHGTVDPRTVLPLFRLVASDSGAIDQILESGSFEFLLTQDGSLTSTTMLLVISLANNENMDLVLRILSEFGVMKFMTFGTMLYNYFRFAHLKPLVCYVLRKAAINIEGKRELACSIVGIPDSHEYYSALHGDTAASALNYLMSYSSGTFTLQKPENILPRDLFEAGLIFEVPEATLAALLTHGSVQIDMHLIFVVVKRRLSFQLTADILSLKFSNHYCSLSGASTIKNSIDPNIFKMLIENGFGASNVDILIGKIDKSVPHVELFNSILCRPKLFHEVFTSLCRKAFTESIVDGAEMRLELAKWIFENPEYLLPLEWPWSKPPSEVLEFFQSQETAALLNFIQNRPIFGPRSMQALATGLIMSRQDGPAALENLLDPNQLFITKILAKWPVTVVPDTIHHVPHSLESVLHNLLSIVDSEAYTDTVCSAISKNPEPEFVASFLARHLEYAVQCRRPFSSIRMLRHVAIDHLQRLMEVDCYFVEKFRHDYYGPRLAKVFADAGLIVDGTD